MNWIEHVVGISPDGGNGMVEALIYGVLVALAVAGIAYARGRSALRHAVVKSWLETGEGNQLE
jgi:hypothetical protein